ncbi:MAG: response regulator transcription factor [Hamadaea sp.]|nr:response regulator transcription factor [Hamadaea sp.]
MNNPAVNSPGGAIRLLVADDEPMFRSGVRAILAADPGIEIVAEASDGREAVELATRHRPDVALLDIRMPKLDGLTAAREIRRVLPQTAVLMLTTFGEDDYISGALSAGAAGFLLKSGDPRELSAGVRAAAEGAAFLSPRVAQRVIAHLGGDQLGRVTDARARVGQLSEREREVLALIGAGLSNQEIGERLFVGAGTVKTHVSSILTRLGLRNRVQAAILAYEAGLSPLDDGGTAPPPR